MNFGWIAAVTEPPDRWDLRRTGWTLCRGHHGSRCDCRHVLVCDTRGLYPAQRRGMALADRPAWRLIMLGVEEPGERAMLLALGCAEALGEETNLSELAVRAQRVDEMFDKLPRWRDVGPLTLDLFHRDARLGSTWLRLHPREFGVLWRLADTPGERVTRRQLLTDVWRTEHVPQTNSVEVHVSRLRAKLAAAGCARLVETVPEGGYRLTGDVPLMFPRTPGSDSDALDRYLRQIDWGTARSNQALRDELAQNRR